MVSMVSPHEATNRPHTMATVFVLRKAGLRADGRIFTVHVKTELHVTHSQTLWPYDQVRQISLSSARADKRRAKLGISVRHTGKLYPFLTPTLGKSGFRNHKLGFGLFNAVAK